jgi:hypothetical protein
MIKIVIFRADGRADLFNREQDRRADRRGERECTREV